MSMGVSTTFGGSKNFMSIGGPICQTFVPTTPRYIAERALSPEVAMVSQLSSGTPNCSSCFCTPARGRGRVRHEHHLAAALPVGLQRRNCVGQGGNPVVHAAPEIDEKRVIAMGDLGKGIDDAGHGACVLGIAVPPMSTGLPA